MRVVFSDSCPNPSLMTERGDAKYIRYEAGGDDVSGFIRAGRPRPYSGRIFAYSRNVFGLPPLVIWNGCGWDSKGLNGKIGKRVCHNYNFSDANDADDADLSDYYTR